MTSFHSHQSTVYVHKEIAVQYIFHSIIGRDNANLKPQHLLPLIMSRLQT